MREEWKTTRLADACEIRPPKKEARQKLSDTDLVSFVPMRDLNERRKDFVPRQERVLREVSGNYTYFADNDVLLAKITPCFENGKLGIARNLKNGIGFGSSEFIVFRSKGDINPEYLFYFLSQDKFRDAGARSMTGAVGHKRVPKDFIENYPIPFPPLPEQERIVAILDEAFAAIATATANTEKNLANARELFEGYLNKLSYDKQPLGGFVDIRTGKLNANAAVEGGQYPFFTCSREVYEIDNYAFDCEAILLAGNNASGDFNVKHFSGRFNAYQRTYVITIKTDAQLLHRFLYFQLIRSLKELKKSSVGAGTKFLKLGMIKELMISIPSIKEQHQILDVLEQLVSDTNQFEAISQQKLTLLAELKQSILHKAFSGELTADANAVDRTLLEAGL